MLAVVVASTSPLLDLETCKTHLRVDGDDEDAIIETYADAAVLSCLNHCDRQLVPQGAEPVFRAAALLTLGGLYASRESVIEGTIVAVNPTVAALLAPHRTIRL